MLIRFWVRKIFVNRLKRTISSFADEQGLKLNDLINRSYSEG